MFSLAFRIREALGFKFTLLGHYCIRDGMRVLDGRPFEDNI